MNPAILSRTVTGPGLKSRPMATRCEPQRQAIHRAKLAVHRQREARSRVESMRLLAHTGFVPQPEAPEMPAKLALHQEQDPDPEFSPGYLSMLIGAALGAAAALLFDAGQP